MNSKRRKNRGALAGHKPSRTRVNKPRLDRDEFVFNTADAVVAVDRDQRIVLWNKSAEALFGFKAEEARGRLCYEEIGALDEEGHAACQEDCLDMRATARQELSPTRNLLVRTKAGREVWVSVSTVLIPSRRKDMCVLVHLFRDVSRQKRVELFVEQLLSNVAKFSSSPEREPPITPSFSSPPMDLTGREREVLRLLASGAAAKVIGQKLFISPFTARNHIQKVLAKLNVHSRLEAVAVALRNGLI